MKLEDLVVEVRDKFLNRVGVIPNDDLDLEYEGAFNNVGTWRMTLPKEHPMCFPLRIPGAGIIVTNPRAPAPWNVVFSGPTIAPELAITPEDTLGTVTFEGVDDNQLLADRLVIPFTQNDPFDEPQGAHYSVNNGLHIENVMRFLVNDHASEHAWPQETFNDRRNGLFKAPAILSEDPADPAPLGPVLGDGSGYLRWRYDNLGKVLSDLGTTYGIGFRVVQVGGFYEFHTYAATDKSASIRLDALNETLDGQRIKTSAPKVTRAYIAGQGDLADRTLVEFTTTDAQLAEEGWNRRIETFIDQRQTDDPAELQKAGEEAFADGGSEVLTVQAIPNETSNMEYGVDWHLGEQVTVVADGYEYVVNVVGVIFKVGEEGLLCGVRLGSDYRPKGEDPTTSAVKWLNARVSNLEANVPAGSNDGGWVDALMPGAWIPYGSVYALPGHRVINGVTYLRGMAKDGGTGTIFTLPVGARPSTDIIVPGVAYAVSGATTTGGIGCRVNIGSDGKITVPASVNNTWVSLAGISFPAEA